MTDTSWQWVVVVERSDEDPIVVAFHDKEQATTWADTINEMTNVVWGSDPNWHNYARAPQLVGYPPDVARGILEDVGGEIVNSIVDDMTDEERHQMGVGIRKVFDLI